MYFYYFSDKLLKAGRYIVQDTNIAIIICYQSSIVYYVIAIKNFKEKMFIVLVWLREPCNVYRKRDWSHYPQAYFQQIGSD